MRETAIGDAGTACAADVYGTAVGGNMVRSKLGENFPSCRGDFCSNSVPDFFADWTKNGTLLPDALTVVSHDKTLLFTLATRGHTADQY